jgi:hypothetical protein
VTDIWFVIILQYSFKAENHWFAVFLKRAKSANTENTVFNDNINIEIPHIISVTYKEEPKHAVYNNTMRGNSAR